MSKEKPYEEILDKKDTQEVEINTPYGPLNFTIQLRPWMEMDRLRDECTTIEPQTRHVSLDQSKWKLKRLMACVVKHPFPENEKEIQLKNLRCDIASKLSAVIDQMEIGEVQEAKNS